MLAVKFFDDVYYSNAYYAKAPATWLSFDIIMMMMMIIIIDNKHIVVVIIIIIIIIMYDCVCDYSCICMIHVIIQQRPLRQGTRTCRSSSDGVQSVSTSSRYLRCLKLLDLLVLMGDERSGSQSESDGSGDADAVTGMINKRR